MPYVRLTELTDVGLEEVEYMRVEVLRAIISGTLISDKDKYSSVGGSMMGDVDRRDKPTYIWENTDNRTGHIAMNLSHVVNPVLSAEFINRHTVVFCSRVGSPAAQSVTDWQGTCQLSAAINIIIRSELYSSVAWTDSEIMRRLKLNNLSTYTVTTLGEDNEPETEELFGELAPGDFLQSEGTAEDAVVPGRTGAGEFMRSREIIVECM